MKKENQKIKLIVQRKSKENNWKKIGVYSSLDYKKVGIYIENICNELKDKNEMDFEIISEKDKVDIIQLSKCDAVILVEKYTETKYKKFIELVKMMKDLDVEVLGVIIVHY